MEVNPKDIAMRMERAADNNYATDLSVSMDSVLALCAIAERLEEGVKQMERIAAALEWVKERQL